MDYLPQSGVVSFRPLETEAALELPVLDREYRFRPVSFRVRLNGAPAGAGVGPPLEVQLVGDDGLIETALLTAEGDLRFIPVRTLYDHGRTYILETTRDFRSWTEVARVSSTYGSTTYLFDGRDPLPPHRFYRVRLER